MRSLQGKIVFVYLAVAAMTAALALLALLELGRIADTARTGSQVAEFFDATLELRRFEKNHFLYGQAEDLRENARYVTRAQELLRRNRAVFAALAGTATAQALDRDLVRYRLLMDGHAVRPDDETLAGEVRGLGNRIVTAGERLAARERESLHDALADHRRNLLVYVGIVAGLLALAGWLLARWVTRPLKAMEASMEAVAQGQLTRLDLDLRERELASLTQAFNRVLDELERRQHTLVRAEKLASLGTLLSGVAHELNNPLSNISGAAQILKEELHPSPAGTSPKGAGRNEVAVPSIARDGPQAHRGAGGEGTTVDDAQPSPSPNPDFARHLAEDIDQETQRAAGIVRSLLDYARDRDFQRRPVALAELLDETLRFLKTQRPPGVEIRLEVPADLVVAADRPRLQQAFLNLIKNALEAVGGFGEIRIAARTGIAGHNREAALPAFGGGCQPGTPVAEIVIADSGPGIPAAILPRIFDPFFTTKPVGQGSGLGLFIVHEIIAEHGGCIGVDSPAEGGTRFYVRLPLDAPSTPKAQP
jgi:signal transduction histidine kinase